jgi:hypothetical protein
MFHAANGISHPASDPLRTPRPMHFSWLPIIASFTGAKENVNSDRERQ